MLTKGIIQSIDYTSNTCLTRIPLFEGSGNASLVELPAIYSTTPGQYNMFKPGDVVIIGFENNRAQCPIILGKLFTGVEDEANNFSGIALHESLKVSESAELPVMTALNYDKLNNMKATTEGLNMTYKTFFDIISELHTTKQKLSDLEQQVKHLAELIN